MKTVLVSGGTRGIGRAIVELFAKSGYNVAFLYKNSDGIAEQLAKDFGAYAVKCDVSDPEQINRAAEQVKTQFGRVDVLVNNAGISHIGLFTDMSDAEWRNLLDTNLSSAFWLWILMQAKVQRY